MKSFGFYLQFLILCFIYFGNCTNSTSPAPSTAPTTPPTAPLIGCARWTNCDICTDFSTCIWCESAKKCIRGNGVGPFDKTVTGCDDWRWRQCPVSGVAVIAVSTVFSVLAVVAIVLIIVRCTCWKDRNTFSKA
eukprot:TRINITY_DN7053_c0_g1_i1.p1 TRINITY_DN7053_c0_g1~~TRINITY_DN7053_c0_g1_i1.p1  ORF type:complete len:134 (-),score=17.30 TRINITY_DN7053_c0_g1_i1:107-508(-)